MKRYSYKLTIIIPAHNEEAVIVKTLQNIIKKVIIPFEIIVIDDCSIDSTARIVGDFTKNKKNIKLVINKLNSQGFSGALKLGFSKAKRGVVVPVMADLCDNPVTINEMYKKILDGWDVVCGSRYMKGGKKVGGPKLQGLLSEFVCRSLRILTGVPTWDASNAFKMYKKEVIENLKFNKKSGVEASMEFLFQAYFKGARITEIPTIWKGRSLGYSKFKLLYRTTRYLRIYLWALENSLRKRMGLQLRSFYVSN